MAKITKRAIKRNKAKTAKTTDDADHSAAVKFDASNAATKAAIDYGVAFATSNAAKALVEQFRLNVIACKSGGMSPKDVDKLMNAINKRIAAKRRLAGIKMDVATNDATWASRKSEATSVMKLHAYKCAPALFRTLSDDAILAILSWEGLYAVSRFVRGGSWSKDVTTAPSKNEILRVLRAKKKRASKRTGSSSGTGRTGVVGMPGDADRGLGHVVKCAKAFDKAHGKMLPANARKLLAGVHANLAALWKPLKEAMKAAEAEAAEKAAK